MIGQYNWSRGTEALLQVNINAPVQIILVPPLFEERNRLRKTMVDILRGLAKAGLGAILPDLPATGESIAPLHAALFEDWQSAISDLSQHYTLRGQQVMTAAFRGGALIDTAANVTAAWRLSPETGERILRDLRRTIMARPHRDPHEDVFALAGYPMPIALVDKLRTSLPEPHRQLRTVRLHNDAGDADARIDGVPLWRRSEPGEDATLTAAILADLTFWIEQCVKS